MRLNAGVELVIHDEALDLMEPKTLLGNVGSREPFKKILMP
jgi:hypothetical protein